MSGLSVVSSQGGREGAITPPRASINDLTPEVLELILERIEGQDMVRCAQVCKYWRGCYKERAKLRHRKIEWITGQIEQIAGKVDSIVKNIGWLADGLLATGDDDDGRLHALQRGEAARRRALANAVYALFREMGLKDSLAVDARFNLLVELAKKLPNAKNQVLGCIASGIAKADNPALAIEAAKLISYDKYEDGVFKEIANRLSETGNFHLMLEVLDKDEFTSTIPGNWVHYSIADVAMKIGDFALAMQQVACMSEEGENDLLLKDQAHASIAWKAAKNRCFRAATKEANAISSSDLRKGGVFLTIAKEAATAHKLNLAICMLNEASKHFCLIPMDKTKDAVIREFVEGANVVEVIRELRKIADEEVALAVIQGLIDLNRTSDAKLVVELMPEAFITSEDAVELCNKLVSNWLLPNLTPNFCNIL